LAASSTQPVNLTDATNEKGMYKLTDRRLNSAKVILDKYRELLRTSHRINSMMMEKELRDCWGLGYQALKGIIMALSKTHLSGY
jgi:hypothetical protein